LRGWWQPVADGPRKSQGRFVGVDLSGRSLAEARAAVGELGVANVELFEADVVQWEYAGPPFDYVIAHGLFSWIPAAAQQRLFAICQRHLSPHGIAYISFNTLPGWSLAAGCPRLLRTRWPTLRKRATPRRPSNWLANNWRR
jgi:SAM-dependent methyltransferase